MDYIERNRGYISASKLKCFIKSPEAYYLQYIKEVRLKQTDNRAFLLGTAFDDALSYGSTFFNEKYFVDDGYTISELVEKCFEKGMACSGKEKKEDLMRMVYGNEYGDRTRLTASDGEAIRGMLSEAQRQPLWDLHGDYEKQAKITGVYKGKLKLRGTLDRLSTEKALIRDWKTTSSLKNFSFELSGKYGYEISMAFYYALVKMVRGVDCDVILDVVQSSGKYQSEVFCYVKEKMNYVLVETIFPALDKLLEMTEEWEETGDEGIWISEAKTRYELFDLEMYPILESGKQTTITYM